MKNRSFAFLACVLALLSLRGHAQNPPLPPPEQDDEKVIIGTSEVVVDAVVKDKKGRPLRDLTAADFEIHEDGIRQQVQSFRLVTRGAETASPADEKNNSSARGKTLGLRAGSGVVGVNAIALVFDRLSADARARARRAALSYVGKEADGKDFIGVYDIDQSLHVLQPFTADQQLVRQALEEAGSRSSSSYASNKDEVRKLSARQESLDRETSASGADARDANRIAEQALNQMNVTILETFERMERDQQGYATTNGLLAVVTALRRLEGRKAIIFFSEGLALPDAVQNYFRAVISNANRANVSIYTVDAAGLRAQSTIAETQREIQSIAGRRQRQVATGLEDRSGQPMSRVMERNEDVLRMDPSSGLGQLADQTGGFLVSQTNDIGPKLREVNEDLHTYYLLSYVPTNRDYDGRFRRIEIKLRRSGFDVQARKGYYAINTVDASPVLPYEAPALAALSGESNPASFPLFADGFNFPEAGRPDLVSIVAEIPPGVVTYAPDAQKKLYHSDVSVVALIRDESRQVVRKLSNQYVSGGPLSEMEAARRNQILFYREVELPPGRYTISVAAYDVVAGKASVRNGSVEVTGGDSAKLRLSSLAILRRAEQLSPAEQRDKTPFHYGELLVYPNLGEPLRQSADKQLAFFLTAYAARGATVAPKLMLEIRQQGRILARAPVDLPTPNAAGRIQYANALPIDKLQPGEYELAATVNDGVSSVSRSRRFVIQ